jgi:integrase
MEVQDLVELKAKYFEDEREKFNNYLQVVTRTDSTREAYLLYFNIFKVLEIEKGLTQDLINEFIGEHNHNVPRAFLKHYLKYMNKKDLEVIKSIASKESKLIVTIPDDHIQAFREYFALQNKRNWLIFELALCGALRRGECTDFKMDEVQNIDKALDDPNYPIVIKLTKTKRKKQRLIVLPRPLFDELVKYSKEKHIPTSDPLFKISKLTWWKYFYDACFKLGFTHTIEKEYKVGKEIIKKKVETPLYHLHSIRHTRSSNWWESGVDIVDIQTRLGHSDISTTRKYITPNSKEQLKRWHEEYEK